MNHIVPPSLLFEIQLSVPRISGPSGRQAGSLLSLPETAHLFSPSTLDERPLFSEVQAGWNDDGFGLKVSVDGKQNAVSGDAAQLAKSDHCLIWLDTRPSGTVHRATEYCQHFACLPADQANRGQPTVMALPIAQQRSQKIEFNPQKMLTQNQLTTAGYEFELWIPASQLYGYREISEIQRLGFFCVVHDTELGTQHLALDDEFPYSYDPSLWIQLELLP